MNREAIVYTTSADGFLLEGLFIHPEETMEHSTVIWVHGNGARFYDYPYVMIGRALAELGHAFVSINTRGHDISAFLWRGAEGKPLPWTSPRDFPVGMGAGWERLEDAPLDIAAWVEWAAQAGMTDVILAGHSAGAQRIVLYQAEHQDERVKGMLFASPDLRSFMLPQEVQEAERLVSEGKGMEVVSAQPFAPWYRHSAQNVMSRAQTVPRLLHATEEEPLFAKIQQPSLIFFGTQERDGASISETMQQRAHPKAAITTRFIDRADHSYHDCEEAVAASIAEWLSSLI